MTPCGPSSDYPGQEECVTLKDCTKDVTGHLTTFKLSADEGSGTEMKLLLARAGNFFLQTQSSLFISLLFNVYDLLCGYSRNEEARRVLAFLSNCKRHLYSLSLSLSLSLARMRPRAVTKRTSYYISLSLKLVFKGLYCLRALFQSHSQHLRLNKYQQGFRKQTCSKYT